MSLVIETINKQIMNTFIFVFNIKFLSHYLVLLIFNYFNSRVRIQFNMYEKLLDLEDILRPQLNLVQFIFVPKLLLTISLNLYFSHTSIIFVVVLFYESMILQAKITVFKGLNYFPIEIGCFLNNCFLNCFSTF